MINLEEAQKLGEFLIALSVGMTDDGVELDRENIKLHGSTILGLLSKLSRLQKQITEHWEPLVVAQGELITAFTGEFADLARGGWLDNWPHPRNKQIEELRARIEELKKEKI